MFKKLRLRETGGGWDIEKNTVKQDPEWWKKAAKDIPGCGMFKKHGLRNEEGLRVMFEDITSDGTDHWNPSSGVPPPSSASLADVLDIDAIQDLNNENTKIRQFQVMKELVMSDDDSDAENDYQRKKMLVCHHANEMSILSSNAANIVRKYSASWLLKAEPRTPRETYRMLRMSARVLFDLHDMLVEQYGLTHSPFVSSYESLAMFLWTLGGCESNRRTQNRFKHAADTIHRKFHEVLNCVIRMSSHYIKPKDPNFRIVHPRIKNDRRAYPHLKNCTGAIDGTHIRAVIAPDKQVRYIGRTGAVIQNVMAVCDFDMYITYASIGQPGEMHDTSVLYHAIDHDRLTFPHPPKGKYYLVDAGYPNRFGYLAPYKGEKYHIPEFHRGVPPTTPVEKFNRTHSAKCNVIECCFGVLKMKWQILLKMPKYSIETQKMIVVACMTLHNYIRIDDRDDIHFERFDRDPGYVPEIPERYKRYIVPPSASDSSTPEANGNDMDNFRDELATAIAEGW